MKKLRAILLSSVMALSSLALATAPVAAQAGLCSTASIVSVKEYVRKDANYFGWIDFQGTRGDTTIVSVLEPCQSSQTSASLFGSYVLIANMQGVVTSGPVGLCQLGYGQQTSAAPKRFLYTPDGYGHGANWPGTLTPVPGHRVRGTITVEDDRSGTTVCHYSLQDITTGVIESYNGTYSGQAMGTVWWGVERIDSHSELGANSASGTYRYTQLAYMGYRHTAADQWIFRTGLTSADIGKEGPPRACETATIGTWAYLNDMVDFKNNC